MLKVGCRPCFAKNDRCKIVIWLLFKTRSLISPEKAQEHLNRPLKNKKTKQAWSILFFSVVIWV